jgi:hypothetical protein
MGKHHEQRFFLRQSQPHALVQQLVASGLPKEVLELSLQRVNVLLIGMVPLGQELAVQLPEALLEAVPRVGDGSGWVGSASCNGEIQESNRELIQASTSEIVAHRHR